MTFPSRMLYGGGLRDEAVPLRLAHYPPRDNLFLVLLWIARKPAATRKPQQHRVRERPAGSRWRWPLGAAGSAAAGGAAGESTRAALGLAASRGGEHPGGGAKSGGFFPLRFMVALAAAWDGDLADLFGEDT